MLCNSSMPFFSARPLSPAHYSHITVPPFTVIAQGGEMSAPADGGAGGAAGGEPQVMVAGVGEIQIAPGERITSLLQQIEALVSEKGEKTKLLRAFDIDVSILLGDLEAAKEELVNLHAVIKQLEKDKEQLEKDKEQAKATPELGELKELKELKKLKKLKKQLSAAIAAEDFEQCAEVRDEIKELELVAANESAGRDLRISSWTRASADRALHILSYRLQQSGLPVPLAGVSAWHGGATWPPVACGRDAAAGG